MRLTDIKPQVLTESFVPVHITMVLREIVKAGKITNTVHTVMLAQLIDFFKCGTSSIRNLGEFRPAKDLLDAVKALPEVQQAGLAEMFLNSFCLGQQCDYTIWCDPQRELNTWISWVLQRQD